MKVDETKTRLYSFPSTPANIVTEVDGQEKPASRYSFFNPEDYVKLSNVDFNDLVQSFVTLEGDYIYLNATETVLSLLSAYDLSHDQRDDLLDAGERLAQWIRHTKPDDPICLLNALQVKKRKEPLTHDEKRSLAVLAEDPQGSEINRAAAYLLLDDLVSAELHLDRAKPEEKSEFREWPIYRIVPKEAT